MRVDDPSALPLSNGATADPNDQVIGVDFSGGIASVAAQLNSNPALAGLTFSASGSSLQAVDDGGVTTTMNALSATKTETSLQNGDVAEFKKLASSVKPHLVRVDPSPATGAKACIECHRERSAVQEKSPHALTCSAALARPVLPSPNWP